jgi:hypothetical protein
MERQPPSVLYSGKFHFSTGSIIKSNCQMIWSLFDDIHHEFMDYGQVSIPLELILGFYMYSRIKHAGKLKHFCSDMIVIL